MQRGTKTRCTSWSVREVFGLTSPPYLSTSLGEISGMYFCRILTCAAVKMPLYISPIPYVMFLSTSFWRPLQRIKMAEHSVTSAVQRWHKRFGVTPWTLVPERERVCKVSHVEVVQFVTLPFECQNGVGAEPDASVHPGGEVHSKEREARVGNLWV